MTYSSRLLGEQRNKDEGNWPGGRCKPPEWLLDKIADEKLTGGYRIRPNRKGKVRNPVCPDCYEARSTNGSCMC
jgi:hypothetical protein